MRGRKRLWKKRAKRPQCEPFAALGEVFAKEIWWTMNRQRCMATMFLGTLEEGLAEDNRVHPWWTRTSWGDE